MPFITHSHCRTCSWWIPKKEWGLSRCKCCNNRLAIKPRLNQNKRKYIEVMKTINWKKLQSPISKNPFGEDDIIGSYKQ